MSGIRQVGIRLKPEGGPDVVRAAKDAERALDGMNNAAAAGADRATAATRRTVDALKAEAGAAKAAESALQRQINANTGVSGAANPVTQKYHQAESRVLDRRANDLLAQLEPARAAQDRLNTELAEYSVLAQRGKISTDQLARAQLMARKRYDETTQSLNRQGGGLTRNQSASRLNLSRQASDVFVTGAMGMNPAMIAIQQGPQIMDAWATAGIKLSPVMVGLAAAAAGVAAAVGVLAYAYYDAEKATYAYERAASGIGRTAGLSGQQLRELAMAGAEAAEISDRAAREQAIAYVSTGKIGGEVLEGLISLSKDYASFVGMDAKEATEALAAAFSEPDKAARDMTRQFGLLDQATLDTIDSLTKQGDRLGAQKLLLEALGDAVSGHSDQVYGLEAAWQSAMRGLSDYMSKLGDMLTTSPEEHVANLERRAFGMGEGRSSNFGLSNPHANAQAQAQWLMASASLGIEDMVRANQAERAQANQSSQEAVDRREKPKKGPRGKSAEQLAREAEARRRREEDYQAGLDLQVARATNDFDSVQRLESEARLRTRIRQLTEDGTAAEEARVKATGEEVRLQKAMEVQRNEAALAIQRRGQLDAMRLLGEEKSIQNLEDRMAFEDSILDFQREGFDLLTATNLAELERNRLVEARAESVRRANDEAERDHQLNLARLSGNDQLYRYLDIEDRIERRAREIERRNGLNRGDGTEQAMTEVQAELNAEATGARKSWIRGLLGDIKQGGIGDALAAQLDRASEHWLDKLAESLAELDWGGFMQSLLGGAQGGGNTGGGGWGNILGSLFGGGGGAKDAAAGNMSHGPGNEWWRAMFGGHAQGTEFSDGGWKWVGEDGPELMRVQRGSQVMDHNRSMMFASQKSAAGGLTIGQLKVVNNGNEKMSGSARMSGNGDIEVILEPMIERGIAKAGRRGTLSRSLSQTPQTIKR